MDRIPQRDKPQERMSKSTAKAGPKPWELSPYIHQEEPENSKRSSHGDPRLENLSLHQHLDSDFTPHDDDHEALHPGVGFGATHDLSASDPSTSDLGTLAGNKLRGYHGKARGNGSKAYRVAAIGKTGNVSENQYQRPFTRAMPGLKMFGNDIGTIRVRYSKR
jgi:hypothetical protein